MTRLYAHRGAASQRPENTIISFEKAIEYGVYGLEMDVHMSSDGVVVVSHDPDGQRMCRESYAIKKTTYTKIKGWDAGWGFVDDSGDRPYSNKGFHVPMLAEVLEHFPNTPLNIDLKQSSPSIVEKVIKIIRDNRAEDRVILASFSQATLLHIRLKAYAGLTCLGPWEVGAALFAPSSIVRLFPLRGLVAQIPLKHGKHILATKEHVEKLHDLGILVDFWTINSLSKAQELLEIGADGIMTDDPKLLAPLFA